MNSRTYKYAAGIRWLTASSLLLTLSVSAQEALQNSLAGQSAADSRSQQMQNPDYTYKNGDFRVLLSPALSTEWNDNVNLSETNREDDYIVNPSVGITSSYQLTERNLLFLDISIGYSRYLEHPDLSTFDLNSSSGTGLSFDIGIKDVTLNVHDWMRYEQDAAQNAAVANTANYGTFQNTAGLSADWDLNQVTLSAGYDHQNVIATSSSFDYLNNSAELFFTRAAFQVHPEVTIGLETSVGLTTYENTASKNNQNALNNNDAYTVGPYVEFVPGHYFKVTVRGGYSLYQFQQSGQTNTPSNNNSWYGGLTISHQLREFVSYTLDAGHEVQLGTESDLTEDWYVRPSINWKVINGWDFTTGFFYTHGTESGQNVSGIFNQNETYDWYGGDLNLSHAVTDRLTLSLDYRLTFRTSDQTENGYTQNQVGLTLTYHFK